MASPLSISLDVNAAAFTYLTDLKRQTLFSQIPHKKPIKKSFTILCTTTNPPTKSEAESYQNPSLSDQLKPLSAALLSTKDKNPPAHVPKNQFKSIWVNPTKPRPSALSLNRHKRTSLSQNPQIRNLRLVSKQLNECGDSDREAFEAVLGKLPRPINNETAVIVLNSLVAWEKALLFFYWVKTHNFFPLETIVYNVVMKSLKNGKQLGLIEELANEMIEGGIELDNITYCTIITCAKKCNHFDKAVEWFERMYKTGVMPDEVTYCAVLDVYAKLGKFEEVRSLYERGRANGWTPDPVTFSVLCKTLGEAGDVGGIRFVMKEMKSVGVKLNLVLYNTLIEAIGKAGKPGFARSLFEDMVDSGVAPNEKTLSSLLKIYGKARWSRNAMELWERMKASGWEMDFILWNTLLSMCADLGLEEEAERLFEDMKQSENCTPDSFSYTAMINIYADGGKVGKAMELYKEMLESGVGINVMACTCMIQCLGRAKKIDDLVEVYEVATGRGVIPDEKLCTCLLFVVSLCKNEDDVNKVLNTLQLANPRLASFVKLIEDEEASAEDVKKEFKAIIDDAKVDVRRPLCNCLIDICRKNNLQDKAHQLLDLGMLFGLYRGLHKRTAEEWSLNVKTLSTGAAITALEEWIRSLTTLVESEGPLPSQFSAYIGAGTHKFSHGLPAAFASHLEQLAAPFSRSEDKAGCLMATRDKIISWVRSRAQSHASLTA